MEYMEYALDLYLGFLMVVLTAIRYIVTYGLGACLVVGIVWMMILPQFWHLLGKLIENTIRYAIPGLIGAAVNLVPITVGVTLKSTITIHDGKLRFFLIEAWLRTFTKIWQIHAIGWRLKTLLTLANIPMIVIAFPITVIAAAIGAIIIGFGAGAFEKGAYTQLKVIREPWNLLVTKYDKWFAEFILDIYVNHKFKPLKEGQKPFDIRLFDMLNSIVAVAISAVISIVGATTTTLFYTPFLMLRVLNECLLKPITKSKSDGLFVIMEFSFWGALTCIAWSIQLLLVLLVPCFGAIYALSVSLVLGYVRWVPRAIWTNLEMLHYYAKWLHWMASGCEGKGPEFPKSFDLIDKDLEAHEERLA